MKNFVISMLLVSTIILTQGCAKTQEGTKDSEAAQLSQQPEVTITRAPTSVENSAQNPVDTLPTMPTTMTLEELFKYADNPTYIGSGPTKPHSDTFLVANEDRSYTITDCIVKENGYGVVKELEEKGDKPLTSFSNTITVVFIPKGVLNKEFSIICNAEDDRFEDLKVGDSLTLVITDLLVESVYISYGNDGETTVYGMQDGKTEGNIKIDFDSKK